MSGVGSPLHLKKWIFLVLVTGVAIAGCSNNTSTAPDELNTIYPLGVGTTWEYTLGRADTVAAHVTLNGKDYARISGTLFPRLLVRMEEGRLLTRESELTDLESVLFDFNANPGDSWAFAVAPDVPVPTVTMVSKTDEVTVPAGTFTGCYTFFFNVSNQITQDVTYVVAPDVGLIKMLEHSGVSYELTSYTPAN